VVNGVTGVLFDEQSVDALVRAMLRFEQLELDPAVCRSNAERFDRSHFAQRLSSTIRELTGQAPASAKPLRRASSM
jgi:hypothetical protein